MKKCISILLALVMLVAMLAIPAAASAVEARHPVGYCPYCNQEAEYRGITILDGVEHYQYFCESCNMWTYLKA